MYVLEAGLEAGLELPYTCRGGICGYAWPWCGWQAAHTGLTEDVSPMQGMRRPGSTGQGGSE